MGFVDFAEAEGQSFRDNLCLVKVTLFRFTFVNTAYTSDHLVVRMTEAEK